MLKRPRLNTIALPSILNCPTDKIHLRSRLNANPCMKCLKAIYLFLLSLLLSFVSVSASPIELKLDVAKTGAPISPFIYGQFIEHLGRCIYGGVWAEMLEDRKFYFPITTNYNPYRSLRETDFPVVGASPWQII